MPRGESPFEEMVMEFVGELLASEGYKAILVVTDWFTKVQNYILAKITWTVAGVVDTNINKIWRLDKLLRYVT